jgi:hypothetical protein
MAKKKPAKKSKARRKSRFNLSPKSETALAVVGGLFVAAAAAAIVMLVISHFRAESPQEKAQREQEARRLSARWEAMNREGLVAGVVADKQALIVDGDKWRALLPTEREPVVADAVAHLGWSRCFVYERGENQQIGWYTPQTGYRDVLQGKAGD